MRRVRVVVTGRVQGVAFRASTAAEATRLGIVGWVKNRSDGGVELEAQGEDAAIATLLAWCAHGPPSARVDTLAPTEISPREHGEPAFTIRR